MSLLEKWSKLDLGVKQSFLSLYFMKNQFKSIAKLAGFKQNEFKDLYILVNEIKTLSKYEQKSDEKEPTHISTKYNVSFDVLWAADYFEFNKTQTKAIRDGNNYGNIRSLNPITQLNNTVQFKMNGYSFFGIANHKQPPKDFPGYTANAWMIRNSTSTSGQNEGGGLFYNNKMNEQFVIEKGVNFVDKNVIMTFDFDTKKLFVECEGKKGFVTLDNINVKKPLFWIWALNSKGRTVELLLCL